jgi:hypothetical protein
LGPKLAVSACLLALALTGCGTGERERDLPQGGTPTSERVDMQSAQVRLAHGGSDLLNEGPTGWTISAAGCRPTAPEQPYDCELED